MKIILGVILGIFMLIGCTLWLGYSTCNYPIKQSNETNQTTSPNEKDCSTYRSTLVAGFTQIGVYLHEFREEIVAVGTIFIAAFTIILGFATAALYKATRDLVKSAERTAERQLRAYLSIAGIQATNLQGIARFQVQIKNSGQTPAYDATFIVAAQLATYPITEPLMFPPTEQPSGRVTLGAGTSFSHILDAPRALTTNEHLQIRNGSKAIYVHGIVKYIDAFKIPRETKFRFMIGGGAGLLPNASMSVAPEGNEAN